MIQEYKTSAAAETADKLDLSTALQGMAVPMPQAPEATPLTICSGPDIAEEKTVTTKAEIPAAAEVTLNADLSTTKSAIALLMHRTKLTSIKNQWRWLYMTKAP